MYNNSNKKKEFQLGQPLGTAYHKLRKNIIFSFATLLNKDICYRCGVKIINIDEFSIEHKIDYLDSENPLSNFMNIENIAFSHLVCNVSAKRKRVPNHGGSRQYALGCRCQLCQSYNTSKVKKYREKKKQNIS